MLLGSRWALEGQRVTSIIDKTNEHKHIIRHKTANQICDSIPLGLKNHVFEIGVRFYY